MYTRHIQPRLIAALRESPVVLLHGARQTGKSTLVQQVATGLHPATYVTLDDASVLASAKADPAGFVAAVPSSVVIDEVQRAPDLIVAIKAAVDRDRRAGRFLLTGSANIYMLPTLSESLAGRMEILPLWPLSQGEIDSSEDRFIDTMFGSDSLPIARVATSTKDVAERIMRGGYPEVVQRVPERRGAWFGSYLTAILQRDVRELAQRIERLDELPRLLAILAARSAGLLNVADVGRDARIPATTLNRYLALLRATFLVSVIPAWTPNIGKRLIKSPKLLVNDTGLAAYLLGLDAAGLLGSQTMWGRVVETFCGIELQKLSTWSHVRTTLYHFRTEKGEEVDFVLEDEAGRVVGIEVKSSRTVADADFRGLRVLADVAGARFRRGVLLHLGSVSAPFGNRLNALPISALWRITTSKRAGASAR